MSNELSLVFYIVCFSLAALFMWWGINRKTKIIIGLGLAIPVLVAALRLNVGTDYANYVLMFESMSKIPLNQYFSEVFPTVEFGFFLLIKLSEWIASGPFLMFLGSAALIIGFFYVGLRKYDLKNPALIYWLYLLIIFPTTLNGIRQSIAAAICFYAITFIISRKPAKYFLWIFIASLFHISALFLVPLYLINLVIKNRKEDSVIKTMLVIGAVLTVILVSLPYIFAFLETIPVFATYVQYLVPVDDGAGSLYSKAAIVALAIFASKWIITPGERTKYHCFIVFTFFEVLISIFGFSATIDRMALYFSFFSIFIITSFTNIFKDVLGKTVLYFIVIAYGFIYFYLAYYVQNYGNVMPYQSII